MMKDGLVEEYGTHEELMGKNGAYAKLYCAQMELEQYGKEETA